MNDLQKIEFDLFRCFIEICEKLNLRYFIIEGSAIGAARHGGFIPWDDDLDVGMFREDYNKFMELAPEILPKGIFLQNHKTDSSYPYIFAKLRNSNTTYIQTGLAHINMNHGVYMDIFPLDGYPEKRFEQKKLEFVIKYYGAQCSCSEKATRTWKGAMLSGILRVLGCHKRTDKILAKFERYISKFPVNGSKFICNFGSPYGKKDYILSDYYGEGAYLMFEGLKVRVPANYDGYLTSLYGDWRMPPPLDKQKGHHYYDICDTKKPYTDYVK